VYELNDKDHIYEWEVTYTLYILVQYRSTAECIWFIPSVQWPSISQIPCSFLSRELIAKTLRFILLTEEAASKPTKTKLKRSAGWSAPFHMECDAWTVSVATAASRHKRKYYFRAPKIQSDRFAIFGNSEVSTRLQKMALGGFEQSLQHESLLALAQSHRGSRSV